MSKNTHELKSNLDTAIWVRKWIDRKQGATNCLMKELAAEDPHEYFRALRMSEYSFNILLNELVSKIQRSHTLMREAIPAKTKLQAVLYYLATGNRLRSLEHLFRISNSSLSLTIPEVFDAIYDALKQYIKEEWQIEVVLSYSQYLTPC
ncbi:hypothetical protein NQ317_017235 [Molorchus minor]|uniref:DUF8040 domain-containing protein n=1 Tax=Molorchus minor TaxID=1323400 RepID=A0ABQ9JFS0_9CUCU|nr:hypothetical protein NQ317_017235 [Molorchus minor]